METFPVFDADSIARNRQLAIKRVEAIREIPKVFLETVRNIVVLSVIVYASILAMSPFLMAISTLVALAIFAYCVSYVVQITPRPGEPAYNTYYRTLTYFLCVAIYFALIAAMIYGVSEIVVAQGLRKST